MRVFICWSGTRSGELADKLSSWLPKVIGPDIFCSVSTKFNVGERWFSQLLEELEAADAAIVCFTAENLDSRWMHFEAGMLFRSGQERVLPYFLGTAIPDIKDPLNAIQATAATREGTWRLVVALAHKLANASRDVSKEFDEHWPELHEFFRESLAPRFEDIFPHFEALFERKTFREPIEDCHDQDWISRYDGARETLVALSQRESTVERCCEHWQLWLYRKLLSEVDGYVRDVRDNLVQSRRFDVAENDKIDFARESPPEPLQPSPRAIAATCARRCREIRHIVYCLTRPEGAPQLSESLAFAKMTRDQFDDKKRLVHSKGMPVDRAKLGLSSESDIERFARSMWDFDRIMYYRIRLEDPASAESMARLVEQELHQAEAEGPRASKMPLHYAVKAWLTAMESGPTAPFDARQAKRLIDGALIYLDRSATPQDDDPKIRGHVQEIAKIIESRNATVSS